MKIKFDVLDKLKKLNPKVIYIVIKEVFLKVLLMSLTLDEDIM